MTDDRRVEKVRKPAASADEDPVGTALRTVLTRVRRDQRGISLIELMMTAAILSVVLGAILAVSETTAKLAPDDDERALIMQEARTGVHAMSRELRHATAVTSVADYELSFTVGTTSVTYSCTEPQPAVAGRTRCTRRQGTDPPRYLVSHVVSQANGKRIFRQTGKHIAVEVQVAAGGDRVPGHKHTITLADGAYVRNLP